jgi:hypothetical protein
MADFIVKFDGHQAGCSNLYTAMVLANHCASNACDHAEVWIKGDLAATVTVGPDKSHTVKFRDFDVQAQVTTATEAARIQRMSAEPVRTFFKEPEPQVEAPAAPENLDPA